MSEEQPLPDSEFQQVATRTRLREQRSARVRAATLIVSMFGSIIFAIIIILINDKLLERMGFYPALTRLVEAAILLIFIIISFSMIFLHYLRTGNVNVFDTDQFAHHNISSSEYDFIPNIAEYPDDEIAPQKPQKLSRTDIMMSEMTERIELEIDQQGQKANVNLLFGTVGAIIALSVVGISVFFPPKQAGEIAFWSSLISRFLFSITASIFAFFFLSMYRRNLNEIRYFHNEMTNIESKFLAIKLCKEDNILDKMKSEIALMEILKSISLTERNFILKKGETTVDLQQKEIDQKEHAETISALASAMANGLKAPERFQIRSRAPVTKSKT